MNNLIKYREIKFDSIDPAINPAQAAMLLLADLQGMESSVIHSPTHLVVSYDVTQITLDEILTELGNNGYHIYNSLLAKLKQALYNYTEQTQRANIHTSQYSSSRKMFMQQYQCRPHGCRDQRPQHWRSYL